MTDVDERPATGATPRGHTMHKLTVLVSAAIGALTVLVPGPTVQAAMPLRCGDTITTDVVLTRDLTCSGTALHVSASGVTVDLAGHRVRG